MSNWLKCDLHAHTTHSDGNNTPEEMIARYEELDFDAVAITDHDRLTKVKKGNANIPVGAVDVTNGTVNCAPIVSGDDFTVYYRSNLNVLA